MFFVNVLFVYSFQLNSPSLLHTFIYLALIDSLHLSFNHKYISSVYSSEAIVDIIITF